MLHEYSTPTGGCSRGCAPSRAEHEAKGNLQFKNEQTSNLDSFLIRIELSTCVLYVRMVGGHSQGWEQAASFQVGANATSRPPLNEILLHVSK